MNRRKFLGDSAKQFAVLNLAGFAAAGTVINRKSPHLSEQNSKFLYRTLGKTGIKLPVVSMGVMNANNPGLLKAAWDLGIRHFDTAWYYQNGNNERMVGTILRELNVRREDVTIATKVGLFGPPVSSGRERKELFLKRFAESLDRLKMEYTDILYYHAVEKPEQINDPYIMEAFTELKAKKQIKFSGFSIHTDWTESVTDAANRKFYDVILLSYNYSMFNDQRIFAALKLANESGIGLVAMKTQCQQDWYKQELPAELQKYYGESNMNSALLKWALQNEYITTAIPGFTTYEQLNEDIAVASDIRFSREEEDFLKNKNVKLAIQSVCRHCGDCVGSCPFNADIPSLMRTHMYSLSYGNALHAKLTLSEIPKGSGLDLCSNCNQCSAKCKYKVPVPRRITELKEIYC